MLRRVGLGCLASVLMLAPVSAHADEDQAPPPSTGVGCSVLVGCGVGAYDPATNTGNGDPGEQTGGSGGGPVCVEKPLAEPPDPNAPVYEGHTPTEGTVVMLWCDGVPSGAPYFSPNAGPGGPPPVDPAVLAQQAYEQIPIAVPAMNFGPTPTTIAVRYWTYLWVDDQGEPTATATAGAVSVTATAHLESVIWSMGEPVSADALSVLAPPIECDGGFDPGPDVDIAAAQPLPGSCAYMYEVRSTAERTGGRMAWPVTASATWVIDWVSNTGVTGTITAPPFVSTTAVCVGAWRTVIVDPDSYVDEASGCVPAW